MKAYIYILWMCLAALATTGCVYDQTDGVCPQSETVSLRVGLNVPGITSVRSRSMTAGQEKTIDYNRVQVLAFQETASGEVFSYPAVIERYSDLVLTLKVPKSRDGEKYRFVVLANAGPQNIPVGTPKADALNAFEFECAGTWDASSPEPIPMWGEYEETFVVERERVLDVLLHRALARVDVGLRFAFNEPGGDPGDTETVLGISSFKIKEIRVYRTRSSAYAATSSDRMSGAEVVETNIPSGALYNTGSGNATASIDAAEADPLTYILPAAGDAYLREIYIPESLAVDGQSTMDEVPCIVVGGYYAGSAQVTHYRADFATYNGTSVQAYKPVLRNHRYVFDIRNVAGPGFPQPEEALHAINSDLTLQVVDWNEVPLNHYVQGDYYLRVSSRDVTLEARTEVETVFPSESVVWTTNLALDPVTKPFAWRWGPWADNRTSSDWFDVAFDYANHTITFTAKQNNVNLVSDDLSDLLTVRVENFEFDIRVGQKASNLAFTIDCESVEVHGKYREGVPLNYTNFISLQIVSEESLLNQEYEVRTLEANGIHFMDKGTMEVEGTFISGTGYVYDLQLAGYGTPVNETGSDVFLPFTVTIVSNSMIPGTCSARVILGYRTKRILTIGANAVYRFGYVLEPNTASRAFMDAHVNFGTDPNSTVTMEYNESGTAFTIEYITNTRGMTGEVIDYAYLLDKLNTFKPDIILTGQAINYSPLTGTSPIALLASFVDAGGVFLMFNEYYPNTTSIRDMVRAVMNDPGLLGGDMGITTGDLLYTLPAGDAYLNDPILNGPFGDMRGLRWGSDGTALYGFTNLSSDAIRYSWRGTSVCMFRHTTKPFVFIGDGGFISNSRRFIGGAYTGSYIYYPFAIDAAYRPIPRTNYTSGNVSVFNSQIFGNIVAWAVDQSEVSGITYPETGNKFPITP